MHFVHVIVDNRAPSVSVGEIGVDSGNERFYHSSSVDITEAFPLKVLPRHPFCSAEQPAIRR